MNATELKTLPAPLKGVSKKDQLPSTLIILPGKIFNKNTGIILTLQKWAQLMSVIGVPVVIFVNYCLIRKPGITAMNAYRMRLIQ